jgi:hypothetical protein
MRAIKRRWLAAVALSLLASGATAASPFPSGYDAAYQAFIKALPAHARTAGWLTKLNGVTSQPKTITIAGKPALYLFACKNHSCDTDNVNIFLAPDHKSFRAILRLNGAQKLLGGAAAAEVSCVRRLDAAGGALEAC